MPNLVLVALDLMREALHRRWLLAIVVAISAFGVICGFAVRFDVIDGLLVHASFFGHETPQPGRSADLALRPLLGLLCWAVYLAGVPFGTLACSDFAVELLAPGRVEHMLSLPLRRAELLAGTYLGALGVALLGSFYFALVFTLLLGLKAGVWSLCIVGGALAAVVAWIAVYGAMLASAVFVRSAALSSVVGIGLFITGVFLTHPDVAEWFEVGPKRWAFLTVIAAVPRFWMLARLGPVFAGFDTFDAELLRTALGTLIFGVACVMLAIWEFERRDY